MKAARELCVLALLLAGAASATTPELRVGVGLAPRLVSIPMGGLVATQEVHGELEATWALGGGLLGGRVGLLSTWFWPYGGHLCAVYRGALLQGPRAAWVAAGALGLEIGPETLSNKDTAWVTAIASAESGVELVVGPGRLGLWVRLQAKAPSSLVVSPSLGIFLGYTF